MQLHCIAAELHAMQRVEKNFTNYYKKIMYMNHQKHLLLYFSVLKSYHDHCFYTNDRMQMITLRMLIIIMRKYILSIQGPSIFLR